MERCRQKPWAASWTGTFSRILLKIHCCACFKWDIGAEINLSPPGPISVIAEGDNIPVE
ncbi:hypothetical protein RintRC_4188 [Richelia intracellularis]|nr:hypothetical protein RintRC_4188 [Richelia intracellularis]